MELVVGKVSHYYSHIGVAAVVLTQGELRVGDTVHIRGHTSDFLQPVESMEVQHRHVEAAHPGDDIALKVNEHAREHDTVYKVVPEA